MEKEKIELTAFFLKLIKWTDDLELNRLVLNSSGASNPKHLFNTLKNQKTGILSQEEITQFTKNQNLKLSKRSIKILIKLFDKGSTDNLSYKDFLTLLLPNKKVRLESNEYELENPFLTLNLGKKKSNIALARFFQKIITPLDEIVLCEQFLSEFSKENFSIFFNTEEKLDFFRFQIFFESLVLDIEKEEIKSLFGLIDIKKRGYITYKDFSHFLSLFTQTTDYNSILSNLTDRSYPESIGINYYTKDSLQREYKTWRQKMDSRREENTTIREKIREYDSNTFGKCEVLGESKKINLPHFFRGKLRSSKKWFEGFEDIEENSKSTKRKSFGNSEGSKENFNMVNSIFRTV